MLWQLQPCGISSSCSCCSLGGFSSIQRRFLSYNVAGSGTFGGAELTHWFHLGGEDTKPDFCISCSASFRMSSNVYKSSAYADGHNSLTFTLVVTSRWVAVLRRTTSIVLIPDLFLKPSTRHQTVTQTRHGASSAFSPSAFSSARSTK